MSTSVGRVNLDLGINQKGLKKEITSSGRSMAKALSATMSTAVGNMLANLAQTAIKSLGGFLKSSVELGSSVAELENVTGKVFPSMQSQVESFSKSAIQQYGLTELQAKKMVGTMGAMAQSFKFTEKEAFNMSTQLTSLVGDVASFYNLDHDAAYTKIKSVFTGETESLKELGVVMTQTALDEFALQKGMGKTVQQMSEQEKVALRLAFVTEQLGFAQGDFAKTQHQWANQTRILSGQWDSFKTALGQGFIAVLTPVIQRLNELMGVVVRLGEKFRDFIMLVTGQGKASGAGALVKEVAGVTTSAAEAAETASGTASKAAKEVKKSVMGFDKLNKLTDPGDSSGGGGGGSSVSSIPSSPLIDSSQAEASSNSVLGSIDKIKKSLEDLASWTGLDRLWAGIQSGIEKVDFEAIKTNAKESFDSLIPIASAGVDGMGEILRSKMGYIGTILGGFISLVGKNVELALGGLSLFLSTEGKNIESWIRETSTKIATGFDNLSFSAENIFGALWQALDENEAAIEGSISDTLSTITNASMTIGTIFSDLWEILTKGLADFTSEEKPLIEDFFSGIVETLVATSNAINTIVGGIFADVREWWERDGKGIWGNIVAMIFDIIGWVMKLWNEAIKPVIDKVASKLSELWTNHLSPLWQNILSLITSVMDFIFSLWNRVLKPIVDWLVSVLGPVFRVVFGELIDIVGDAMGETLDSISRIIGGIRDVFSGLTDFIEGVFTGDWKKAWEGVKKIFEGIWESIRATYGVFLNPIIGAFERFVNGIIDGLNFLIKAVNKISFKVPDWVPSIGGKQVGFNLKQASKISIPRLAEGGFVKANQPQLAMIGDNKRHGEIVAPEDKLYEIVSKALQAFMAQLIAALNSKGSNSQRAAETLQVIVQLGEETIINRLIKLINAESKRQGSTVIKV